MEGHTGRESAREDRRLAPLRRVAAGALLAAASALVLLAGLEWALRAARVAPARLPAGFRRYFVDTRRPFFRRVRKTPAGDLMCPSREETTRTCFLSPKPAGTYRVFVVGGSVAQPFSEPLLAPLLSRLRPSARFEVIGCGVGGYSSVEDLRVLREVLRQEADAVVVLSGNNESRAEPRWPAAAPAWMALSRLSLAGALSRLGGEPDGGFRRQTPERARTRFEANLRAMAAAARARGVPLVLCTLPANLRDAPPMTSDFPFSEPAALRARSAWEKGRPAETAALLQADPTASAHPQKLYLLGRALERLGRPGEAAPLFRAAADADDPGIRTPPARNAVIRRVALEEGQPVADLEASFASLDAHGVTGAAVMRDACHWRTAFYPWVAALIADALAGTGRLPGKAPAARRPTTAPPALSAPYDRHEWQHLFSGAVGESMHALDPSFSEGSLSMMARARAADPRRFAAAVATPAGLRTFLIDNGSFGPGSLGAAAEIVWSHVGEALRREGDAAGAAAAFARARLAVPQALRPRLGQALVDAGRGDVRRAAARLRALAKERPSWEEPALRARLLDPAGSDLEAPSAAAAPAPSSDPVYAVIVPPLLLADMNRPRDWLSQELVLARPRAPARARYLEAVDVEGLAAAGRSALADAPDAVALFPPESGQAAAVEDALAGLADEARRRGVRALIVTAPVPWRDPPWSPSSAPLEDPDHFRALRALAEGDAAGAEASFRARLRREPDDPHARHGLFRALMARGRTIEARREALLAAALGRASRQSDPRLNEAARRAAARSRAGLVELELFAPESAAPVLASALTGRAALPALVRPETHEWARLLRRASLAAARARGALSEPALDLLARSRAADPKSFDDATASLGALLSALPCYAAVCDTQDVAEDPEPLLSHLGAMRVRQGDEDRAEAAYREALLAAPASMRARVGAAVLRGHRGDPAAAAAELASMAPPGPSGDSVRLWAAYWAARAGAKTLE